MQSEVKNKKRIGCGIVVFVFLMSGLIAWSKIMGSFPNFAFLSGVPLVGTGATRNDSLVSRDIWTYRAYSQKKPYPAFAAVAGEELKAKGFQLSQQDSTGESWKLGSDIYVTLEPARVEGTPAMDNLKPDSQFTTVMIVIQRESSQLSELRLILSKNLRF